MGLRETGCFVLLLALSTWSMEGMADVPSTVTTLATANNGFAMDMYQELSTAADGGNVFFSPFSISSALAMTLAGAAGNTLDQMREVLGFDQIGSDAESLDVHMAFRDLFAAIEAPANNYTLAVANRLFGRQGYQFLETFLTTTQDYYSAMLEELDFVGATEASRQHINQWVENKTNDKIKDLLPEGSIDKDTAMVLVNAIYFKGAWKLPFEPSNTIKKPFYTAPTETVDMDMMTIEQQYLNYLDHSDWNCQILELPYEGDRASMVILLPREKDGLATLESSLSFPALTTALHGLNRRKVQTTTLPKFRLTQAVGLKDFLSKLGMSDLFDAGLADLSRMAGSRELFVSAVLHKAFVDVNEEGTEAAGATGVIIGVTSVLNPITVMADHPFLFLIRDTQTGSILFMGRLMQPPGDNERLGSFRADGSGINGGSSATARGFSTLVWLWLAVALTIMTLGGSLRIP